MREFKLPDLGEGLQEVEIISWHVGVGDNVVADQPLLSVETDKAVVDVPAPVSGRILHLHGKPGDIIKIGETLVEYDLGERNDAGSVVGSVEQTSGGDTAEALLNFAAAPIIAPPTAKERAPLVMPALRALAQKLGVDLAHVRGTGPQNAMTREDVEAAASHGSDMAREGYEPLKGIRKAMATHMIASRDQVVPATIQDEVDISSWFKKEDVTTRLILALVQGCKAVPAINAWFDDQKQSIKRHPVVDLGIAVDTDDGLFVPVLRGADGHDASLLRSAVDALKKGVHERTLTSDLLKGPTITLSNFGMMAGIHATMVIVPPQVAILGAGRIHEKAAVVAGEVVVRWTLPLSLTIDHRAVTGGEAARFLAAVIAALK